MNHPNTVLNRNIFLCIISCKPTTRVMAKLLTVFGATGQQRGALIYHILANPSLSSEFTLLGVTLDGSKPTSIALKEKGVEIVEVIAYQALTLYDLDR
jgi:hypothetical protein